MDELIGRAMRAYFMTAAKEGYRAEQPANDSAVKLVDDKEYVTLRNCNGILAVYRVKNNGMLRRLKRWPQSLEDF